MDDKRKMEEQRKNLREKYKRDKIECGYKVQYPISTERKYQKLVWKVLQPVKKNIEAKMALILAAIDLYSFDENEFNGVRSEKKRRKMRRRKRVGKLEDAIGDLELLFMSMELLILADVRKIDLRHEVRQIADELERLNQREWARAVKETIGLEVPEGTYYNHLHAEAVQRWVEDNTAWVSGISKEVFSDIKGVAYASYLEGKESGDIFEDMKAEYESSLRKKQVLVINRVSNINTEITKQKHLDAGIYEYIWWTRLDERVRISHRRLHGKKFSWDTPPETDGGRHCHPGEDFGCRCIALPSFNLKTIDL